MLTWIREKFGTTIIAGIIGFIGFVFVFYGFFSPSSTRGMHEGSVAGKVNGDSISLQDFNRELNRRMDYFKQMMGGSISEEQLKAFHLRESVFDELARRKLLVQEAYRRGTVASDEEIKTVIQEMPYFQKNGKFDLLTYKEILENNHFTPSSFERQMREDLSAQQWNEYFRRRALVTPDEAKREYVLQNDKRSIKYVLLTNETGRHGIVIPPEDVKKFLGDPAKLNVAKAQYEGRKAVAYKDKSFDDVKESIAKDLLAGERIDEIRKLNEKLADQVKGILTADKGSDSKVNALLKTYDVQVKTSPLTSRAAPQFPGIGDNHELMTDVFASKSPLDPAQGGQAKKYVGAGTVLVAVMGEKQLPDLAKFETDREKVTRQIAARKQQDMFQTWIGDIRKKAKVEMNPSIAGSESEG